jgi:small subunit ribosomal protein S16
MVRLRLRRVGATNQPSYRVVATDSRNPRDGRFIEVLGYYNPRTEPATMEIDEARALHWLQNGAKPSDAVNRILDKLGTLDRFARLRQGEPLEDLLEEAAAAAEARPEVDPRTRRDDLEPQGKKKKKAKATPVSEPETTAEVEEEEAAEEEEEAAEPEAEAEAEAE